MDVQWKPDATRVVKQHNTPTGVEADLSTDFLPRNTLERSGAAMEMADLMGFMVHEHITAELLQAYLRPAQEGYQRITLEQLNRARQEIFKKLIKRTCAGVKHDSSGRRPLDVLVDQVLADPDVHLILMPLSKSSKPGSKGGKRKGDRSSSTSTCPQPSRRQKKRTNQQVQEPTRRLEKAEVALGGRSKGKGNSKSKNTTMPTELMGMHSRDTNGNPICFGFNTKSGCDLAQKGGRCKKGHPVCCVPRCYSDEHNRVNCK